MRSPIDLEYSDAFTADDDRTLILGHFFNEYLREFPRDDLSRHVLVWLGAFLTDERERTLFNLPPLTSDGNVIPFKRS